MNNIFEKLKTLYQKYKNLKQYPFTHILSIGTLMFFGIIFANYIIHILKINTTIFHVTKNCLPLFYIFWCIVTLTIGIIQFFKKTYIQEKFFLENKTYNIFWNIGNILFIIFITLISLRYRGIWI